MTKKLSKTIEKKILPEYFDRIATGEKTYELRLADWKCEQGDTLILVEVNAKTKKPTGRTMRRKVGYVGKTKGLDFWTDKEIAEHGYQIISLLDELPVIRIKDAWLFRENISLPLNELWGNGEPLRTDDEYAAITKAYQDAWQPYELKVLTGMTETLGLSFRQEIIDVYIAPWINAFSDPLVIGVTQEPDVFIDILTHELLHRLLTDNTTIPHETQLLEEWQKLFGKNHTLGSVIHIPVHAVHKAIYLDVLKQPKRLERDIADSKQYEVTDYLSAWDYVEKHDYKEIIEKLKKSYEHLREQG